MCKLGVFVNIHFHVILTNLSLLVPKLYNKGVFETPKYLKTYLIFFNNRGGFLCNEGLCIECYRYFVGIMPLTYSKLALYKFHEKFL